MEMYLTGITGVHLIRHFNNNKMQPPPRKQTSSAARVGSPHHLLAQGGEVFLTAALHDFYVVWCLAYGEPCLLAALCRLSVDGNEEVMVTALHGESYFRVV